MIIVNTKEFSTIVRTASKLIKHPKLSLDAFSQLAVVVKNKNLYIVSLGLSVPNSQITTAYLVKENVDLEDEVYFFKDKDLEKVFSTLGSETSLTFEQNHLTVYSNHNGLVTNVNVIRQRPKTPEVEALILSKMEHIISSMTSVDSGIDSSTLVKKLNNLLKFKSLDSDSITFEPNRLSVQQHSYVAQEPFNFGFTARLSLDEVTSLIQALNTVEGGILAYKEDTGLFSYSTATSYFEITQIKSETYSLDKFVYTDDNQIEVNRQQLLSALSLVGNYVNEYSNIYLLLEEEQLIITTTLNKEQVANLTVPVMKLPVLTRGSNVVNRDYGVNLPTLKTLCSIVEDATVQLYFEYREFETSLVYLVGEETTNFMLLETYESVGDY